MLNASLSIQDNKSAIKRKENECLYAGSKSRHVDIRYFWIKDCVLSEGITIRHYPTETMLVNFYQAASGWDFPYVL